MPINFVFHEDRAHTVLYKGLYCAYRDKTHLFSSFHTDYNFAPQQRFVPRGVIVGSIRHAVWLSFVALMNVRSKSMFIFHRSIILYERYPELFTRDVLKLSQEDIAAILAGVGGFAYPNQWSGRWYHYARTLFNEYNGNPLLIFEDVPTVEDFLLKKEQEKKKRNKWLYGYGHKIYSLPALFYEELGLIPHAKGAIPVDEHHQRICLTTGVVECFDDQDRLIPSKVVRADKLASFLRPQLSEFIYKRKLDMNAMAHAKWIQGSEGCANCPRLKTLELVCPIHDLCSGGLNTQSYTNNRLWVLSRRTRKGEPSGQKTLHEQGFMSLRIPEYDDKLSHMKDRGEKHKPSIDFQQEQILLDI